MGLIANKQYDKPLYIDGRVLVNGLPSGIHTDNALDLELWLSRYMGIQRNGIGTSTVVTQSPVVGDGSISDPITLNVNGVTPGTYSKYTVDQYGLITSGSSINSLDVTTALTFTPYDSANPDNYISDITGIAAGGDLTGTYPNPSLGLTTVTPGSYTAASFTVDSKGRITGASSNSIPTALPPNGSAGGDLTGTYPNPTLAAIITAGSVGSSSAIPVITYDNKGRITGVTTATPSGSSGVCGISNASGVYTYYPTLQDACTAVSSGQTIEIFADITLSAGVTLAVSCNINFNGHTVTCTHATQYALIFSALNGELNLFNGKLVYTGGGAGTGGCLSTTNNGITINSQGFYYCTNTTNATSNAVNLGAAPLAINNAFCIAFGNGSGINMVSACVVNSAVVIIKGNGNGISGASYVNNCVVNTNSNNSYYGIYGIHVNNCSVISTSTSTGILVQSNGEIHNCSVLNTSSGNGILPNNGAIVENTTVTVNTGKAVSTNSAIFRNCVLKTYGGSNPAVELNSASSGCIINNCSIMSQGGAAISLASNVGLSLLSTIITKNTIRSNYNNAAGHGIICAFNSCTGLRIIDNTFIVTNASANGINTSGTSNTIRMSGNQFAGSTTNVHANITQELTVAADSYGNITI